MTHDSALAAKYVYTEREPFATTSKVLAFADPLALAFSLAGTLLALAVSSSSGSGSFAVTRCKAAADALFAATAMASAAAAT